MSTLGSWIAGHYWVGEEHRERIRALKSTIRNSEIKYDLGGTGERNAFTKAALRIATKIVEAPRSGEVADWYECATIELVLVEQCGYGVAFHVEFIERLGLEFMEQ